MNEKQYGTESIGKIFLKVVVPSIFAMLFSSIGMIIDGVFVGNHVGSNALAAVNIVMPIFTVVFALSDMIAAGSSVKVAMALGKGEIDEAKSIFSASILMSVLLGVIFLFCGVLFGKDIISFFIKDVELAKLAYEYTMPFIVLLPLIMIFFISDNFLRVCGKVKMSMWISILTTVMNIFLDWLLIGQLNFGVRAAAYATALSMTTGAVISLIPFLFKNVTLRFSKPKISIKVFGEIIYNGSSVFFENIASSVMAIIINAFLLKLGGAAAVSALSIVVYIDSIIKVVLMGMTGSLQPVISYNAGVKNYKRIGKIVRLSNLAAFSLSILCMSVLMIFKDPLVGIFINSTETEVINMTKTAIALFVPSYLFSWFSLIISSLFTSLDMPKESLIIMIFNSVIFPLSVLIISTRVIGLYGVFVTETISAILSFVLCFIILRKLKNKEIVDIKI